MYSIGTYSILFYFGIWIFFLSHTADIHNRKIFFSLLNQNNWFSKQVRAAGENGSLCVDIVGSRTISPSSYFFFHPIGRPLSWGQMLCARFGDIDFLHHSYRATRTGPPHVPRRTVSAYIYFSGSRRFFAWCDGFVAPTRGAFASRHAFFRRGWTIIKQLINCPTCMNRNASRHGTSRARGPRVGEFFSRRRKLFKMYIVMYTSHAHTHARTRMHARNTRTNLNHAHERTLTYYVHCECTHVIFLSSRTPCSCILFIFISLVFHSFSLFYYYAPI